MQTLDFVSEIDAIVARLGVEKLFQLVRLPFEGGNTALTSVQKDEFASHAARLTARYSDLTVDQHKIADQLGFDSIAAAGTIADVTAAFRASPNTAQLRTTQGLWQLYFGLGATLRWQRLLRSYLVAPKVRVAEGQRELAVEIHDFDGGGVQLVRLGRVVKSLLTLYENVLLGLGLNDVPRIAYLDSGSSVIVSVKGIGEAIDAMLQFFLSSWEQIRDHKNIKFERRLTSLDRGLEFLGRLQSRVESKEIDQATADKVEAAVWSQMDILIGDGAMARGVETTAAYDKHKVLMQVRDIKQLNSGSESPKGPKAKPVDPDV